MCDQPFFTPARAYQFDPIKDTRWGKFLECHPRSSVFHTTAWLEALRRTYGYEPIAFTTCPPEAELSNGAVFCLVNSWLTGRRIVSLPFSDHCEVLVDSWHELDALSSSIREKLHREGWDHIETRPLDLEVEGCEALIGFCKADRYYLHRLNLAPHLEHIWRSFHKDSVQRRIRRAEREGLQCEEGRSQALLDKFYSLLLLTRRRHQLPPQPLQWFRNLAECMGDDLKIRVASQNDHPIASIVTLSHGKSVVYKYGCSDARFHNLGGIALLFWKAIQEAKREGRQEFDFGRSDFGNLGLTRFKDHWGTTRTILTYWRYPAAPSRELFDRWPTKLARTVLAHMPDSLLTLTGRILYRHMA